MDSIITRTECLENKRMNFLPNAVGKEFFRYEQLTYAFMDKACVGYQGGYWNFYSLSNDAFYMALQTDEFPRMQWHGNYFDSQMSPDAAGIGISLMVQNAFAYEVNAEFFGEKFHALRDYAAQHKEAGLIFRFID